MVKNITFQITTSDQHVPKSFLRMWEVLMKTHTHTILYFNPSFSIKLEAMLLTDSVTFPLTGKACAWSLNHVQLFVTP